MPNTFPRFAWRFSDQDDAGTAVIATDASYPLTIPFRNNGINYVASLPTPTSRGAAEGEYAFLFNGSFAQDLADAIADAMNTALGGADTIHVVSSAAAGAANYGKVLIYNDSGNSLTMQWLTIAHTFPEIALGFIPGADYTDAGGNVVGTYTVQRTWWPSEVFALDNGDQPVVIGRSWEASAGVIHTANYATSVVHRDVNFEFLERSEILVAAAGTNARVFEQFWLWAARGERFWYVPDTSQNFGQPNQGQYVLREPDDKTDFARVARLQFKNFDRWMADLRLRKYVTP